MIHVYKMGMSYYANSVDKNSGMTEVKIITNELNKIKIDKKVLVIINGIRDEVDNKLLQIIKEYDFSIFIMSDSIALETSLDIMNACDYVLHQAPYHTFEEIHSPQTYSYVPELFYKYCKKLRLEGKIDAIKSYYPGLIYFGGNNKKRDDKFRAYKVNESPNMFSRYKLYETGKDTRIGHLDYLNELSRFSYSLVICREDYRKIGWITSRYFEAIALDNVPFIDYEYDIFNFVVGENSILRVNGYKSLMSAKECLSKDTLLKLHIMRELKLNADKNLEKFKELIEEIIK